MRRHLAKHREAGIFLIVGSLTVLVDFLTYHALLWAGAFDTGTAKAVGFVTGTVFAYFANRLWTFGAAKHSMRATLPRFVLLYAVTLGANVLLNQAVLHAPFQLPLQVHLAFLIATGVSAVLNFLGMKLFVFRRADAAQ